MIFADTGKFLIVVFIKFPQKNISAIIKFC